MRRSKVRSSEYPPTGVVQQLSTLFRRNGYVRRQNPTRLAAEGFLHYKKGDEVRLVAATKGELRVIRELLRAAGFEPGRPFAKGRQFGLPIYGRGAVERFLALIESDEATTRH